MNRRHLLAISAALAFTTVASQAQDNWPAKPIKIVSPFPAGGTSDVMARMLAPALSKELGQPVIIENVGGAGGTIGTLRALQATPDGYTLIQTGVGQNAVAHGLDPKLAYDSNRDFIHLTQVHTGPNVLVVHPDQPFKSFQELISYIRKNPGKLNYGYTHAASGHMAMELLKQVGGLDEKGRGQPLYIVGIPYRGGGPMMQDLLGGQTRVSIQPQRQRAVHIRFPTGTDHQNRPGCHLPDRGLHPLGSPLPGENGRALLPGYPYRQP